MNPWTVERSVEWYAGQPWLVGCNFIPSTAVNQLEMWQRETFDRETIQRELGFAAALGMNTVRTYLHDVAWEIDPDGFKSRVGQFLDLAQACGIRPVLVLFDDCWNPEPRPGPQPAPIPGVHNSGWLQSPGISSVNHPASWPRLEAYVRDMLASFGSDDRVLMWDLYNEPGANKQGVRSLPLLCKTFEWARDPAPAQPLTCGIWSDDRALNAFQIEASAVISFHCYSDAAALSGRIADLRAHGRPLICTEWLRRGHSDVATCLPVFARERVGCFNWGLVSGRTQTIFPWGSPEGAPEPGLWFHDLLRLDGSPYNPAETASLRQLTREARAEQQKA